MIASVLPRHRVNYVVPVVGAIAVGIVTASPSWGGDVSRWPLAFGALSFLLAREHTQPIAIPVWLASAAGLAWCATALAGLDAQPMFIGSVTWLGLSMMARSGERALAVYLPRASNDVGYVLQWKIRRELIAGASVFLLVFLVEGYQRSHAGFDGYLVGVGRQVGLVLSALLFVRFVLLQSSHLGIISRPAFGDDALEYLVPSQRWPIAIVFWGILGLSWLATAGHWQGFAPPRVILTALLLLVLAALLFVASVVRLQRIRGWSRQRVRAPSFVTGLVLSLGAVALLVALSPHLPEGAGALFSRRAAAGIETIYLTATSVFLLWMPILGERSAILNEHQRTAFFIAPVELAIMVAPLVTIVGHRRVFAGSWFWVWLLLLFLCYYAVVALRKGSTSRVYALVSVASFGLLIVAAGLLNVSIVYRYFLVSLALVWYSIDLFERSGRAADPG